RENGREFVRIVHQSGDSGADWRCHFKGLRRIPCATRAGNWLNRTQGILNGGAGNLRVGAGNARSPRWRPVMLKLRPNCEYCDKDLPPLATEARICSYECTFCAGCVDTVLFNVCPNCGGGFVPRPVRPSTERRKGVSLAQHPASTDVCISNGTAPPCRPLLQVFATSHPNTDRAVRMVRSEFLLAPIALKLH